MMNWLIRLYRTYEAGRIASARERARIYGYRMPTRSGSNIVPANDRAANDARSIRRPDAA